MENMHEEFSAKERFKMLMTRLQGLKEKEANNNEICGVVMEFLRDLPKFEKESLVETVEFCEELIRDQTSSFTVWKDLIPPTVSLISKLPKITVNEIAMTGPEYRSKIFLGWTTLRWPKGVVISLAEMFRDMAMTKEERETVMKKLCDALPAITPSEIPSMAYQLFSLSKSPTLLIMPILSLQKYFNSFFYQKMYEDLESNTTSCDSVEEHSDKEMRNFEETVLYHLSGVTEFSMTEREIVASFRALSATPYYILTPFVTTAVLTISKTNRQIDMKRLSQSLALQFLRSVIKNAQKEKQMASESLWCRNTFNRNFVNVERLFEILFEQSKVGMDVVTPGFVGLLFTLLKAKNQPDLNSMAINLLQQFLRKRQQFGRGIVKDLLEFLLANYEAPQLAECMNNLSLTSTLAVSECIDGLKNLMDFLLMIPGHHAMRIVTFIYPLIRISYVTRDYLIDTLRKAMFSNDESTRTFGIYGFGTLLKHMKNSNCRRAGASNVGVMSQVSISGFSMMSQSTLGSRGNPNRDFDMLTMEILGILRKVFDESVQMKEISYDTLLRAVDQNTQLAPHILFFIDYHFRNYFEVDQLSFVIKFKEFVHEHETQVEVWDNLGALIYFVGFCVFTCDKYEMQYDTQILKKLLEDVINRIVDVSLESIGISGSVSSFSLAVGQQFLHCLEGVMAYCALASTPSNHYLDKIGKVFEHYEKCRKSLKEKWESVKKPGKKGKSLSVTKISFISQLSQVPKFHPDKTTCIWDFATLERFLIIIYEKADIFGSTQQITSFRENRDFHCHVLKITRDFLRDFPSQPEYKHVAHSRRLLMLLCSCSKILFKNCVKNLIPIMERFDVEAAALGVESFKQCLITADVLYKKKLCDILRFITNENQSIPENVILLVREIEELLEKCMTETSLFDIDGNSRQIPGFLLSCLEMLYSHIPPEKPESSTAFNWLKEFCQKHSILGKNLDNVHKMLFQQYMKTDEGLFLSSVASQLSEMMGIIQDDGVERPTPSNLKSIEEGTAESCLMHLLQALRKELTDVEYLITKMKSILARVKIMGATKSEEHTEPLIAMEKAVCMHLIKVANCLLTISNMQIKLGAPVETTLRLIISYYSAVTGVTKHLIARHPLVSVLYSSMRFDKLVQKSGGSLAKSCYQLIKFIYELLTPESDTEMPAKEAKNKGSVAIVVRNTRYLSSVVREMENFSKFVRILCRKTKDKTLEKYLQDDCVRDFRIKTDRLKDAIEDEMEEISSQESDAIDSSDGEEQEVNFATGSSGASTVHDNAVESDHEEAIRRNVQKVRDKMQKKSSESELEESPPKRARRGKTPLKLNKRAAEIVVPSRKKAQKKDSSPSPPAKRTRKSK
ncbi:Fanconi anemia group I protein [Phlebotomus argentipes]|uniref:Fanconi anemia group I protein n=1 Tax=Phlebotomus argentipes TaxID=94469 RepID=UPI002892F7A0|nr:Fanconi anemia group I protein [Phlebotomus argentipes]